MLGGLFGVVSKKKFITDLVFGIDYHSHLGTEIGGIAFLDGEIEVFCHDISNSQFKSEFIQDVDKVKGNIGIGVISDERYDQPLRFESNIGVYALCISGYIRNATDLYNELKETGATFKKSLTKGRRVIPNQAEIVGELISRGKTIVDGIEKAFTKIEGTVSLLLLSQNQRSIYAYGEFFPLTIGRRESDWAISSETSAFHNLGYKIFKFLEYGEIASISEEGILSRINKTSEKKYCPFLHVYFGFPTSDYYGINAEIVRERCGAFLAENDDVTADLVLGVADSGLAHSIGFVKRKMTLASEKVNELIKRFEEGEIDLTCFKSDVMTILDMVPPLRRPLVKYTPGWGRSYIPPSEQKRETTAKYKQIPNPQIIKNKRIVLVDDSIRRGTQLKNLLKDKIWPFQPKEVHGRIASPPQIFPCIHDISTKVNHLATYKAIKTLISKIDSNYFDPKSIEYKKMIEKMGNMIGFTTLKFISIEDLVKAIVEAPNNKGLDRKNICLYCWTGIE